MDIEGDVTPGFEAVVDAFRQNFVAQGEIGAAVAVYHQGRLTVDLAGGSDPLRRRPFARDSLVMVASCTKGATATCILMLAEQGRLAVDEKVAVYWPEFAQADKQDITLQMVLSHRAGLPYPDPGSGLSGLDLVGGPQLVRQLERQAPWWPPGSAFAYHPVTWGAILGEVVRRVTGETIGQWFAANVAAPLGLEFWIGLPASLDERVVPSVWAPESEAPTELASCNTRDEGSFAARRLLAVAERPPREPDSHDAASRRAYYGLEVPAAHGVSNARSLARMYAAVIGEVDGSRLLSAQTVAAATAPQTDAVPALAEGPTAGPHLRFGLGYQLRASSMPAFTPASFGHTGAGGRLGIADPDAGVALAYVCNSIRDIGPAGDPRWAPLIDAIQSCL